MSQRQFQNLSRFTAAIFFAAFAVGAAFTTAHVTGCAGQPVKPAQFVGAVVKCADVPAGIAAAGEVARCLVVQDAACVAGVANAVHLTYDEVLCVAAAIRRGQCTETACTQAPAAEAAAKFLADNKVSVSQ